MFEDMLVEMLKGKHLQGRAAAPEEQVHIGADQENVLRYVMGFVPFKLLQTYRHKDT